MLHSVIEAKKKYYPQALLEEFKYEQKRIKMENLINDDLEKSESDSDFDSVSHDEIESDMNNSESDE